MGKIFYIMGKSASGKDHIYEYLKQQEELELYPMVLYTTRPIREGECNGREYFFTDETVLQSFREQGRIIERGSHKELIDRKGTYYQLYTGAFELE